MAKANGTEWVIRILIVIGLAAIAAAVAFGDFRGGTEAKVEHIKVAVDKHEVRLSAHSEKITILETRQEAIFDGVERIQQHLEILP